MVAAIQKCLLGESDGWLIDFGLLVMRLLFGLAMVFQHGLGTFAGFSEFADKYHDPIGLGSRNSMVLMIFAELFCAAAVSLGLLTRLALIPLIFGFTVAVFIFYSGQPFENREMAYLYLSAFVVLMFLGPGRFSLDGIFFTKASKEGFRNE